MNMTVVLAVLKLRQGWPKQRILEKGTVGLCQKTCMFQTFVVCRVVYRTIFNHKRNKNQHSSCTLS